MGGTIWAGLSLDGILIFGVNKRDLEAEDKIRKEKKKNRAGPPIMKRDSF